MIYFYITTKSKLYCSGDKIEFSRCRRKDGCMVVDSAYYNIYYSRSNGKIASYVNYGYMYFWKSL